MNSLKGASFPQIAISVCKLCRASVESGSKHNHLKSSELLEDPGSSPTRLKSVSTPSSVGPYICFDREASHMFPPTTSWE
jgi:hypothetical protein